MAKSLLKLLAILIVNALVAIVVVLYIHIGSDMYPGDQELLARKCVIAGKTGKAWTETQAWINWFIVKRNARYADVVVSARVADERFHFTCLFEDGHPDSNPQGDKVLPWTVRLSQLMAFNVFTAKIRFVNVTPESGI